MSQNLYPPPPHKVRTSFLIDPWLSIISKSFYLKIPGCPLQENFLATPMIYPRVTSDFSHWNRKFHCLINNITYFTITINPNQPSNGRYMYIFISTTGRANSMSGIHSSAISRVFTYTTPDLDALSLPCHFEVVHNLFHSIIHHPNAISLRSVDLYKQHYTYR